MAFRWTTRQSGDGCSATALSWTGGYLYRAADSTGSTVEFFMSAYRDLEAAKSLFRRGLRNGAHPQGCRYHAHHHFRGLTGMTPPQYQKQIQLQAARARMLADDVDAATVAFEVGYESPSQFNPEYSRLFGEPPIRDIRTLRSPAAPKSEPVIQPNHCFNDSALSMMNVSLEYWTERPVRGHLRIELREGPDY